MPFRDETKNFSHSTHQCDSLVHIFSAHIPNMSNMKTWKLNTSDYEISPYIHHVKNAVRYEFLRRTSGQKTLGGEQMMYWRCPAIINQMGDWSTNGSIGFYIVSCIIFFHILLFCLCLLFLFKVIVREQLQLLVVCHPLCIMSSYHCQPRISVTHVMYND